MKRKQANKIVKNISKTAERNLVIIDFGNVDKWEESLDWKIGIRELGNLSKRFSKGKKYLRKFYYGSDYGKEDSEELTNWSNMVLSKAKMSDFEVNTKKVKYIKDQNNKRGYEKKCDFDVEMAVDLISEVENYDTVILFSGDGDLAHALKYVHNKYGKEVIIFGARNHVGAELFDLKNETNAVENILFAEDFGYRLRLNR